MYLRASVLLLLPASGSMVFSLALILPCRSRLTTQDKSRQQNGDKQALYLSHSAEALGTQESHLRSLPGVFALKALLSILFFHLRAR